MKRAYKFRLYPTRQQEGTLENTLDTCRLLWNLALEDRRIHFKETGKSRSYEDQAALLIIEKLNNPAFNQVHSQVLQDVLRRLKKAFDNFFRRLAEHGRKKGYPRFKKRYRSFTYPQSGFKLEGSRLDLAKIGSIRIFAHREIEGKIKICTITMDKVGSWFAVLTSELDEPEKIEPQKVIGVDVGLTHAVTTSEGQYFDYPRYYAQARAKREKLNRALSRKELGSNNRNKARLKLAKIDRRITNLRDEFLHQVSKKLVDAADVVVFEKLNINGMVLNGHLAKSILDVSWNKLMRFTLSKAESAGKYVIFVDPKGTSQRCSACGSVVPKTRKDRVHDCKCGLKICRDLNSSIEIRTLGLREIACRGLTNTLGSSLKQVNLTKQEALPFQG
jgi:putative transposase